MAAVEETPLRPIEQRAIAGAILAIMVGVILGRVTGAAVFSVATWIALLTLLVASARAMRTREFYLLGVCAVITAVIALRHPDPLSIVTAGLDQAAMLTAFILILGLLYEGAVNSPSIVAFGPYITRQPPSRRYVSIYFGTGVLSVLFNQGILAFMIPIVQQGVWRTDPDDPLNPVRERRQVTAIQRGFAWGVVWSPTALAPLLLLELIPGIHRAAWLACGFATFLLILIVGAIEDAVRHRRHRLVARREGLPFPASAALRLVLASLWLFGLAVGATTLTGGSFVVGLMIACPIMMIGWIALQNGPLSRAGWRTTGGRLATIVGDFPRAAPVAITLAAAGYMGRAGAAMVPPETLGAILAPLDTVPDFLVLSAIPPLLALVSLMGLSPVMMAVFVGSLFGGAPSLPVNATLLALAISSGWGLALTFSPLISVPLVISRISGIDTVTLTWRWNLAFTVAAALVMVPVFALLTVLPIPG